METQAVLNVEPPALVAHVLVDTDLPHLDHVLDYTVPDKLSAAIHSGTLVRVRLAGKLHDGWVHRVDRHTEHQGRLSPIVSVSSAIPIVPQRTWDVAHYVARRHAATMSQVLSLAIPQRHAAAEKGVLEEAPLPTAIPPVNDHGWVTHPGGGALISRLAAGESPRAVWTAVPGSMMDQLAEVVIAVRHSGRDAIVVVPTVTQARHVTEILASYLEETPTCTTSEDALSKRYADHIRALRGLTHVVVGTRSATWMPVQKLGLIVIWDEGDDRLREQRAPRVDALDVAVARAHVEGASVIAGGWARTVKAQALVHAGWAASLVPQRAALRGATPRVVLHDHLIEEREGAAGRTRLPPQVYRVVRTGLESGPVLVQVPRAGYVPVVSCAQCHRVARCSTCHGPLRLNGDGTIRCGWCGRPTTGWSCTHCGGTSLKSVRVGSDRTGEELGRAFPGVPLAVSSSTRGVLGHVDDAPRLVVATPGAEPQAPGRYAAGIILDAQALAGRPELWAPEEAARRWMNAAVLVRPGAPVVLVGDVDPMLSQALVRWDPADLADRLLEERISLGFFPAATIIALDGPADDVNDVAPRLGGELMGIVPHAVTGGAGPSAKGDSTPQVRALIRTPLGQSKPVLENLRQTQQVRSSRHRPLIRVTVNPPELF